MLANRPAHLQPIDQPHRSRLGIHANRLRHDPFDPRAHWRVVLQRARVRLHSAQALFAGPPRHEEDVARQRRLRGGHRLELTNGLAFFRSTLLRASLDGILGDRHDRHHIWRVGSMRSAVNITGPCSINCFCYAVGASP